MRHNTRIFRYATTSRTCSPRLWDEQVGPPVIQRIGAPVPDLFPSRLPQDNPVHEDRPAFQARDGIPPLAAAQMPAMPRQPDDVTGIDKGVGDDMVVAPRRAAMDGKVSGHDSGCRTRRA